MNVLVTIYIPTYNRLALLKRALNSVLKQTYRNIEVIIVDDASNDGTGEYLEWMSKQDSRVKFFIKSEQSGACVSRNIAIKNANGLFITGLDDDDYFLETRVYDFVEAWKKKKRDVVFLYSLFITKTNTGLIFPNKIKAALTKKMVSANDLKISNYPGNQIFIDTKTLKAIDGFDSNMPAWQDLDTWYRILSFTNGKGERIKSINYVYDTSHAHERISKKERHINARDIFLKKNNLLELEDSPFFLVNYKDEKIVTFLKRMYLNPTVTDVFIIMSKLLHMFKSR